MLTLLKPEVSCNPGTWKGSSIQKSKQHIRQGWPQVTKPNLKPWSSFDANTLNALNMKDYGYILDLEIHPDMSPDRLRLRAGRAIGGMKLTSPAHIINLIKWNDKVLQQTLGFAKTYLKRHTGANLRYRVGDSETSDIRRQTGILLDIDHIVKLEGFPKNHALVIGLARPSTTFNPSLLLYGKVDPASTNSSWIEKDSLFLLRQLAHHCDQEETRYGYIMTGEEFTACHFYDMPSTAAGTAGTDYQDVKEMGVELVRIPWRHSGQDVELTTDLALWWLCMKRLSQLENGDPTRTGSQETHDTEQFPHIPHQGLHVGFNAQMPVVPPPLQASENHLDVDGQSPDSEESDDMSIDMWGSEEQDPNLVTTQEEDTEIPSNQPPKMIDTAMEENWMDNLMDEISYGDEINYDD